MGGQQHEASGAGLSSVSASPVVLTFLIADVRGYTRFTQDRGDEEAGRLAALFAELARETVLALDGELIELRGDEALCVFGSARQALRAAVELQRAFRRRAETLPVFPLPVGIGLDAGEAVPIEGGYRGGALNTAARLCSLAAPGQILASETVVSLARRVEGIRFVERRATKVKGLEKALRVIEVVPEEGLPPLPEAVAPKRRRVTRGRMAAAAAAGLLVVVGIVAFLLLSSGGRDYLPALDADALGTIDANAAGISSQVKLPGAPSAAAAGEGSVWVASKADGTVTRLDPRSGHSQTVTLDGPPGGVAYGDESLWVTDSENRKLVQINPRTSAVVQRISVGNSPGAVAFGDDAVWVVNEVDGTVSRFDLGTGSVTKTVPVGPGPAGIAAGLGGVWMASENSSTLLRIDPASGDVVQAIPVGNGPTGVAIGAGSVWVANTRDGTVSRIDPSTNSVRATVPVGTSPSAVAAEDGAVWVADGDAATVSRIDPETGDVAKTLALGSRPSALALAQGKVYAATVVPLAGHRGGVLRVEGDPSVCRFADPACAFFDNVTDGAVWWLVYDGLVAYRRVGGTAGATLVPDLAARLPAPSDGRKTYTFRLRKGIRYSDGSPVRASDFRPSVERFIRLSGGVGVFSGVVGAEKCRPGKPCDLSAGIVADDRAGTITIRLTRPDNEFLYALTFPGASFVPARSARSPAASRALPGTGPYRVASFDTQRQIRLTRNPHFRVWSRDARPDGYPAEVRFHLTDKPEPKLRAVERGDSDWVSLVLPGLPPSRLREVLTRYADRLHSDTLSGSFWLFLNTRVPPFDDVRVRQALNYAADRQAMIELAGGQARLRPTCQMLPPSFPGYRPYCPYTRNPTKAGTWSAPDMAKARALVAASGTAGARVELVVPDVPIPVLIGRYYERLLRQLGYRARMRIAPQNTDLLAYTADSRNRVQLGTTGWFADRLVTSNFFRPLFTCGAFFPKSAANTNLFEYCNPRLDAKIEQATALQATDPARAAERWAEIDRMVVDQAVAVPWASARNTAVVSKRVGNYESHPLWGTLLDQLWVK
jgi:YVTN family beta-propeller protein